MSDLSRDDQWKIYETSQHYIDLCSQRQWDQDEKSDKRLITLAAGSFGLSFAFIDTLVSLDTAVYKPLLIGAWACFAMALIMELCGFMLSSFTHSVMANEERDNVSLKYQGKPPEYKNRSVFSNSMAICGYASLVSFIGGVVCLLVFIAKNFAA
jgi:hypothetical protein